MPIIHEDLQGFRINMISQKDLDLPEVLVGIHELVKPILVFWHKQVQSVPKNDKNESI